MECPSFVIIGECQFHNQLLQDMLEKRLQLAYIDKHAQQDAFPAESSFCVKTLLLWDCLGSTADEIREKFGRCFSREFEQYKVVFYNMPSGLDLESEALAHGVKGIFYMQDTLDKFEKGVLAVLNDELWFSRANISKYLNNSQQLAKIQADDDPASLLTTREKQILSMVATGCNNRKIAEALCISPHTVKTHLNNIFGKINVSDRVQALLWTIKYL